MLKRAVRLALIFITAASAAFLSAAQPVLTGAAAQGTLFAITGPSQSALSRVDPASGTITQLGDFAGPSGQGQVTGLTGDPATHRLFGLRFTTIFTPPFNINVTVEILTIDSRTGALLADAQINRPMFQVEFDSASGSLLGLDPSGIVKIDPATGSLTPLANLNIPCCGILAMTLVPGTSTVYVGDTSFGPGALAYQILTVDTSSGSVTTSPSRPGRLGFLTYDPSARLLLTNDVGRLFSIDPPTGVETTIATFNTDFTKMFTFAGALDPSTHTAFVHIQSFVSFLLPPQDQLFSINDQTGAFNSTPPIDQLLWSLYFEAPPPITPESIKADVRAALASGAIDNAGVADSLLAKLNAAAVARAGASASPARTNACSVAANIYRSFIAEVTAQSATPASGVRPHIAAATASQLIGEAQFLIANCP